MKIFSAFIKIIYCLLLVRIKKRILTKREKDFFVNIVEIFHSFIPDFIHKEEVQVPLVLKKLLSAEWTAYITRPIYFHQQFPEIPFVPMGTPIPDEIIEKDSGLYSFTDMNFGIETAAEAAKFGNFLYLIHNGAWFTSHQLLIVLQFKLACLKNGEQGFVYLKMDMPMTTLDERISQHYAKPLMMPIKRFFLKQCIKHIDVVSFESQNVTKRFIEAFSLKSNNVLTVLNGVSSELLKHLSVSTVKKEKSILAVARFGSWHKASENLIQAFEKFSSICPDWSLWLVGEMTEEFNEWLYAQYAPLIEQNKILIFGFTKDAKMIAHYYSTCGIYTLPSRQEGASLSLIEAAYFGAPIVATNVGNASDVLDEYLDVCTVPVDDIDALASKFIEFAQNDQLRMEISGYLSEKARKEFNWEYQLQKVADIAKAKLS